MKAVRNVQAVLKDRLRRAVYLCRSWAIRYIGSNPRAGLRLIDELECVAAVLLAVAVAHQVEARNVSWAAFSAYMVMRSRVSESFSRGLLRVVGTGVGAALALSFAPTLRSSLLLSALAGAAVGGGALYCALTSRRAYAWLFVGLTFELVLIDAVTRPDVDEVMVFATTRMLEVVAGTAACVVVSALSAITVRRRWPGMIPQAVSPRNDGTSLAARHAAQAAAALALIPLLRGLSGNVELSQAAVSIMAVMIVPVASLGLGTTRFVGHRLGHRLAGCVVGCAFSAAFLLTARGNPYVLIAGTIFGVQIGRHLENKTDRWSYAGTQFTLAVLVVLVPDSYAGAPLAPAFGRVAGILLGIALLASVLFAWRLVAPRATTAQLG